MGSLGRSLSFWDHNTSGSVRKKLVQLRSDLESIRSQSIGVGPSREERSLMKEISKLLSREELMEKQWSRVDWLHEGDRNTSFFQAKARERAKSNRINALIWEDGTVVTDQKDIENVATAFYSEIFSRQEVLRAEPVLDCVPDSAV